MEPYQREGMKPSFDFYMNVNSTNPELNGTLEDNQQMLSINIWVDSKLELGGTSKPLDLHYNTSMYKADNIVRESDIGPPVIHVYSIRNNGPSDIREAEMYFMWPYTTIEGISYYY